ncbi:MAG TPA: transporter substrate-binding domain-containing protein [Desulfobacterales bacterium]|nr:transporter substrate-binding domain-containing protein [Desulfobacterales bacterium]
MKRSNLIAAKMLMALLLVFMLSTTSTAQDPASQSLTLTKVFGDKVLRVGVNPQFKPFSFENDGKRVGVDIDIANLLAEKLGVTAKIVAPKSFSDLIPMLQADEIDIIIAGMSITFDRSKTVDFSTPYFDTGMSILFNKVKTARLGISAVPNYIALMSELAQNGKADKIAIAVTDGKAAQRIVPRFFPQATIKPYATNEEAAQATLNGDADMMVHDEIFLKVWLKEHAKDAQFRLVVLDPPFKPDYYGMAVRKGNQDFLNMLDVFNLELQSNGHIAQFIGRYLPVTKKVTAQSYKIHEDYYGGD